MIVGKFGNKIFEVTNKKMLTFNSFSLDGDLNTSTEEASKKKPATTIKGPGLLKIGLELRLIASDGVNVKSEIDDWFNLKDCAIAYPFILCGHTVGLNKFLITNCSASDFVISRIANLPIVLAASLKLEFSEYLPPGAVNKSKSKPANKSKTVGIKMSSNKISNPYKVPTSAQKSSAKRVNKGMHK